MKSPLGLSPLPIFRPHETADSRFMEREGFVDEAVVAALRATPAPRHASYPEDLALCADDLDFAGWQLAEPLRLRQPEVPPAVISAIVRRPAPPAAETLPPDNPRRGGHRWWLAGVAGALAAAGIMALLVGIAARSGAAFPGSGAIREIATPEAAPATPEKRPDIPGQPRP